jgi:DNA anti-recombination protein RmuC
MQRSKEASKIDSTTFRNSKLTQLLLANAFNEKLGQKSAILVNIDPYGDFNAASQILRYSALARDVAVPQTRVTSLSKIKQAEATTTSAAMSSQQISRHPTQNAQDQDKEAMASELATAYERIQELENLVADAENEINEVETRVRMEMADEMDRRLTEMQQSFRQRLDEDWERNQDVADRKIAIFSELNTTADPSDLLLEVERLQRENQMLRHENDHLSNIIHHAEMSSPRKRSRVNA